MSDTFNGPVYAVEDRDLFLVVDRSLQPQEGDYVVTERTGGVLMIERYHFQRHYGVVIFLEHYARQHAPTIHRKEV